MWSRTRKLGRSFRDCYGAYHHEYDAHACEIGLGKPLFLGERTDGAAIGAPLYENATVAHRICGIWMQICASGRKTTLWTKEGVFGNWTVRVRLWWVNGR